MFCRVFERKNFKRSFKKFVIVNINMSLQFFMLLFLSQTFDERFCLLLNEYSIKDFAFIINIRKKTILYAF